MAFAKLKALRRARAIRTVAALWRAIGEIRDLFSTEERRNSWRRLRIYMKVRCLGRGSTVERSDAAFPLRSTHRLYRRYGFSAEAAEDWPKGGSPDKDPRFATMRGMKGAAFVRIGV
jgi:hypothetical protein